MKVRWSFWGRFTSSGARAWPAQGPVLAIAPRDGLSDSLGPLQPVRPLVLPLLAVL